MSEDDSVKHEGKWTRANLPSWDKIRDADDMAGNGLRSRVIDIALNEVVEHLNTHYPKPEPDQWRAEWAAVGEDLKVARRQSDLAHEQWKKWEHKANEWKARADQLRDERDDAVQSCMVVGSERDEWKARAEKAEQLIPAYAMLDIWTALGRDSIHFDDWYDEHGYADAWAELTAAVREVRGDLDAARENAEHYQAMFDATERQRDEWKARAEKAEADLEELSEEFADFRVEVVAEAVKYRESRPRVSRADIDRALINVTSNAMNYPTPSQVLGKDTGPLRKKCVDAMCDLLGIEAEQSVDLIEEKAISAFKVAWHEADMRGDEGNRTRCGIRAARKVIEEASGE